MRITKISLVFFCILATTACRKDQIVLQQPKEIHFLDTIVGTFQGNLNYSFYEISYFTSWDLECTQDVAWLVDTSYETQITIDVYHDSGFVISIDDLADIFDNTFEVDSTLHAQFYFDSNYAGAKLFKYTFKPDSDSLYLLLGDYVYDQSNCYHKTEEYKASLKKLP